MTPEQKIKYAIICYAFRSWDMERPIITTEDIDAEWERLRDAEPPEGQNFYMSDAEHEFRESGTETKLPAREMSRHYESDEVAAQMPDGSWVGWTYWHGGGKHGGPGGIEWISEAYALDCDEREETMIVRTFTAKK